jgi:hypothetical protein
VASARRFRLFSRRWFALHPQLVSRLKGYGIPLGIGMLLALASLSIVRLEAQLKMPWASAADVLSAPAAADMLSTVRSRLADDAGQQGEQVAYGSFFKMSFISSRVNARRVWNRMLP